MGEQRSRRSTDSTESSSLTATFLLRFHQGNDECGGTQGIASTGATSHRAGVSDLSSTAQYPPDLSLVPTPRPGTARQQASRRHHPARVANAVEAVYWFHVA